MSEHGAHLLDYAGYHLGEDRAPAAVASVIAACGVRTVPGSVSARAWLLAVLRRDCSTAPGHRDGYAPGTGPGLPGAVLIERAWRLADPLGTEALRLMFRHELSPEDLSHILALSVEEVDKLATRTQDVIEMLVSALDGLAHDRAPCPELRPLAESAFPGGRADPLPASDDAATGLLAHITRCPACTRPINIRYTVPQMIANPPIHSLSPETVRRLTASLLSAGTRSPTDPGPLGDPRLAAETPPSGDSRPPAEAGPSEDPEPHEDSPPPGDPGARGDRRTSAAAGAPGPRRGTAPYSTNGLDPAGPRSVDTPGPGKAGPYGMGGASQGSVAPYEIDSPAPDRTAPHTTDTPDAGKAAPHGMGGSGAGRVAPYAMGGPGPGRAAPPEPPVRSFPVSVSRRDEETLPSIPRALVGKIAVREDDTLPAIPAVRAARTEPDIPADGADLSVPADPPVPATPARANLDIPGLIPTPDTRPLSWETPGRERRRDGVSGSRLADALALAGVRARATAMRVVIVAVAGVAGTLTGMNVLGPALGNGPGAGVLPSSLPRAATSSVTPTALTGRSVVAAPGVAAGEGGLATRLRMPAEVVLDEYGRGSMIISSVSGDEVRWRLSAPGLAVSPADGTLKRGDTAVITVRALRVRHWCGAAAPVTAPMTLHGPDDSISTVVRWRTC
ncbi:hypothetical protein [Planobispora siamensis]|uniref:hypothetical protein n=1 Tax=Planobispora siamensis TaxID=936338 RepID=UPI00194EE33B|nr:hypothetical protein [Planobispora siamensis]